MKKWFNLSLAAFIGALMVVGSFGCYPKATTQEAVRSEASLSVTPAIGKPTDKLAIQGAGFAPGEQIKIQLLAEGLIVQLAEKGTGGVVKADDLGKFVLNSVFPRGVDAGIHKLMAIGNKGSEASSQIDIQMKKK